MNIEELWKRCNFNDTKLKNYGFYKEKDNYIYQTNIMKNTFEVTIIIPKDQKFSIKVVDLNTNYEYTLYRIESQTGKFVSEVREELTDLLTDIKEKCSEATKFLTAQANRIALKIQELYQGQPEFLWKKYPGYAIFRNNENKKWYAAIMNILKEKIEKGTYEVEIIDVKLNPEKIQTLLPKKGFYEAYHMNKKTWITILLDDTLSDEEIMSYVQESYDLTKKKK
ncbi:TPA: MmcQ/YjbR family DNA-binding protein [Candidatus Ventrenecus stercoripullorum]|nr:MmcQ/YjbR family DNA-binding protein [Candidatus Ventrenecus stercoripullorum]